MNKLLLAAIYYLVVTPIGLLSRLVHDPLTRRPKRNADSYWIPAPAHE